MLNLNLINLILILSDLRTFVEFEPEYGEVLNLPWGLKNLSTADQN